MGLKSYRLKDTIKKSKNRKKRPVGDIVKTGVGAVIGIAFISTLTNIIN